MKEVLLTQGQTAIVDDEDYDRVQAFRWQACPHNGKWYVRGKVGWRRSPVFLHRWLLGLTEPRPWVDHINGNPLDNRRENLRVISCAQSAWNRGAQRRIGTKGIQWDLHAELWRARISVDGRRFNLGHYRSRELAMIAYQCAAERYFGVYARPRDLWANGLWTSD